MMAADAVDVYRISGLSLDALFPLFRIFVTSAVIILTLRIPFKRKQHWAFLALNVAFLWGSVFSFLAQSTSNAATALGWYQPFNFLGSSTVQVLLIYQFVLYFVAPRMSRWQKYVLIGGYAFAAVTVWVPALINPTFLNTTPHLNQFGWTVGPGTSAAYLVPSGINVYFTAMSVLVFYLLFRNYFSEKSPLIRGQTKYIIVATILVIAGAYQHYIASYTGGNNIPTLSNLLAAPGDYILLLGLRKKGFYSVTPVAETAKGTTAVTYLLEESRSYLAHDTKASFEAFASLVRNGHEGLSITRIFPDQVRKDYGIQTTPIRWLAEAKGQEAIPPGDLLGLSLTVKDFLQKATRPVVMLQGIEYLTTYNGFTPILKLVQGLTEANAENKGILLLPIVPKSLDEKDEALLVADTNPLPSPIV